MHDSDDPPPSEQCGEQFGCARYNCVREPLFDKSEIKANEAAPAAESMPVGQTG